MLFFFKRVFEGSGFVCLLFLLCVACSPKQIASNITAQIMASGAPSFERESDVEIAQNSSLPMLKMMEAFQYDNPKNKDINTLLARSYANYAQGFLEYDLLQYRGDEARYQKSMARIKQFYGRGKDFGLLALGRSGSFKNALTKDLDSFKRALRGMGQSNVPALFWIAMNWGSLINFSKTSPLAVAEYPKVEAIMERVLELDATYFYGGPYLFFGYSYASRPKMFGGDPVKARDYFEKGVNACNRKFLLGLVFYAQIYAVPNQDKDLYQRLLNEVLSADAGALPEARLANELAKIRAKWLLDHAKEIFGGNL